MGPDLFDDICSVSGPMIWSRPEPGRVEKPVGKDLASARAVNEAVGKVFREEAVFRIDHYLGKETVQNSWRCASPMPCSSRSGTTPTSTTCS